MAINTAEKRFSIINLAVVGARRAMPVPATPVSAQERYHRLGLYAGITLAPPTPITSSTEYIYFARHRLRR